LAGKSKKKGHKRKSGKKLSKDELLFKQIVSEVVGLEKGPIIRRIISKLKQDPRISNFWFSLGMLLSEVEKYDYANEAFNRVVFINPDHKKLWIAKATALGNLGRDEEAAYCFKRALQCYDSNRTENMELKNLVRDIDDLVNEVERRKKQLGLNNMEREDIEYITPNALDLESFISELLNDRAREKKWAKDLVIKLKDLDHRNRAWKKRT
jgi:tetratricopeptide (TPR) repeat protein